ncbi:MAG: hypothetical protein RL154_972, partial [Pseudomonadota bacterium]
LKRDYQLVLVCKLNKKQNEYLQSIIALHKLTLDDVILTGFVSDNDLIALYKACYLFVFPSLHEGFGLPVLEAMSFGTAAIGSNVSSIPEVIGLEDALFNPFSSEDITNKIKEVLENKLFWQQLKDNAKAQSSKFSWDATAKKAIEFLEANIKPKLNKNIDIKISTQNLINAILKIDTEFPFTNMHFSTLADLIEKNEQEAKKVLKNEK